MNGAPDLAPPSREMIEEEMVLASRGNELRVL
jgi:hypothetical protein